MHLWLLKRVILWPVVALTAVSCAVAADLQTILLPIYAPRPPYGAPLAGAGGSRWVSDLTTFNISGDLIALVPCGVPAPNAPPCPPEVFVLKPRVTERDPAIGFTTAGVNGRLLYLRTSDAPYVFFRLAVANLAGTAAETQIPVVREGEFHSSMLELLDVPVSDATRTLLRIYDVDDRQNSAVIVRVFDSHDTRILEQLFPFVPSGYEHAGGVPFAPGYLSLPLQLLVSTRDKTRVEIEPATSGLRFWAFVTVTDNISNDVRVMSPE